MSVAERVAAQPEQPPLQPEERRVVLDPLRRDFIYECLVHVAHQAQIAGHAICLGDDGLFDVQIDLIRLTMKSLMLTRREMDREAANDSV